MSDTMSSASMASSDPAVTEPSEVDDEAWTTESIDDGKDECDEALLVVLQWTLQHAVTAEVELAALSNVCRTWRSHVKAFLLDDDGMEPNRRLLLLPSMIRHARRGPDVMSGKEATDLDDRRRRESFCAAWFTPEGLQSVDIALRDADEDNDDTNDFSSTMEDRLGRTRGRSFQMNEPIPTAKCILEWRGHRTPEEVLIPFGYAVSFITDILRSATQSMDTEPGAATFADQLIEDVPYHQPTLAVRGATIARPESFCLCVDQPGMSRDEFIKSLAPNESADEDIVRLRWSDYQVKQRRQQQQTRELERAVLPRCLEYEDSKAVQFLNAGQGHAVCLLTPFFDCGPLPEPVTIFCVGIATEDGCFLSGLYHRFELGHLYPSNALVEATQLSPIAMATEAWEESNDQNILQPQKMPVDDDDDDQSFMSDDASDVKPSPCHCVFQGITDKLLYDMSDDDTTNENGESNTFTSLHRGRTGPGSWHCYTAVFDGNNSCIRVDGQVEPMNPVEAKRLPQGLPMLDGLSIGSDHSFGMSLCCGQGEDGEGEGSIKEVAVFAGRLDVMDIEAMERQLLSRHNIQVPRTPLWEETDRERHAEALLSINAFSKVANDLPASLPLRYMARRSAVSWHRRSPVTGAKIKISRIGARPSSAESSDW